jgi:hypothetical protein
MNIPKKLESQIETMIPGSYAGALLLIGAVCFAPTWTKSKIEAAGTALLLPTLFLLGLSAFIIYRRIIGQGCLYWLRVQLMWCWDKKRMKAHPKNDRFWYFSHKFLLEDLGVRPLFWRAAYHTIREVPGVLDEQEIARLDMAHTEIHFLYLSGLAGLVGSCIAYWRSTNEWLSLLLVGILFIVVAIIVDIYFDIQELRIIQYDRHRLIKGLRDKGFIENPIRIQVNK